MRSSTGLPAAAGTAILLLLLAMVILLSTVGIAVEMPQEHGGRMRLRRPVVCVCPETRQSVCGADGVTYGSKCMAACKGAAVKALGACISPSSAEKPFRALRRR